MAQWMGQFSGRTHESRVKDAEVNLRRGIDSGHEPKNVSSLAEKLLAARVRQRKARLSRMRELTTGDSPEEKAQAIVSIEQNLREIEAGGVAAILREFGIADKSMPSSPQSVIETLPVSEGHFLLESGLHAEAWIDLDTLFLDPQSLALQVSALAVLVAEHRISAVCGPLIGGAFVAQAVALQLGIRFYFAERAPANPGDKLFSAIYRLPKSQRARAAGERFAILDDVIGAGSAVRATVNELSSLGAEVAVVGAFLKLGNRAENHLAQSGIPVVALSSREIAIWEPEHCPRCQAGVPLLSVSN